MLILADDLGYSDIHAFGGEIDTPNLDALVQNGRVLTNHHVGTVSAITRSMLISGTDHHRVGEGTMGAPTDERRGLPGYEGYLNDSALSIAQLLHDAGYHTYMAGKWHLGSGVSSSSNTNLGKAPNLWGFDRSFALLGGGASNHFVHEQANSQNYEEDGQYVQPGQPNQPSGYDDDIYTSKLMSYIDSNDGDGKPFFAYAAYTAPHWPLQAPDPYLNKYSGKYSQGYDAIRNARIALQQSEGIFPPSLLPYPGAPETTSESPATANYGKSSALYISAIHFPPDYVDYRAGIFDKQWATLSAAEQAAQARYMEVYAGMVAYLDYDIGLLIQHLKDIGHYDDTFIIFHSDNGAEGWPLDNGADPTKTDTANGQPSVIPTLGTDNGQTNANRLQYGLRWAEVSATPFAQSKGYSGEGGVSVPAIVHLPGQTASLPPITQFTHVIDDSATFLDLAGVAPPSTPAP
ncbi:MAG: sulfatase-like hydrolase/transferase, partial [Polyangiaceae bacterium]|nr:sulfatase-like hydrolase/transferase [Polyangiaceae bacterium]